MLKKVLESMLPQPKYRVTRLDEVASMHTYKVPVEYGPTAADTKYYTVKAVSADDAAKQAVAKHKKLNPGSHPEAATSLISVHEGREEDAAMRGEDLPSNIDPNPKKMDANVAAKQIDKLKIKLGVLKIKLAAARKAKEPDERIILGLENDIDIVRGELKQLR
jgi:hypothetical protein